MNTPSTSVPEASSLVFNPYSPPEATTEVVCNVSELQLASRWARLGAAVVDYLLVVSLVFGSQLIYYGNFTRAITESAELGFKLLIILALLETLFYWFINGIFLASDGQTLGKKLLRIRIVRGSGESANLQNLFFRRYLPFVFLDRIPVIGQFILIIDKLTIFDRQKKCLHDHLADTIVVKCALKSSPENA